MSADSRSVRLTIPARPEYITLGRLALTAIAGVHPVSDETLHDLKLALTEACTNSVKHAYEEGGEGIVDTLEGLRPGRLPGGGGVGGRGLEPHEPEGVNGDELS